LRNLFWMLAGILILGGLAAILFSGLGGTLTDLAIRCVTCH
jgi:hypothetical protein